MTLVYDAQRVCYGQYVCTTFVPACKLTQTPEFEATPAWSPDGTKIAFINSGEIDVLGVEE